MPRRQTNVVDRNSKLYVTKMPWTLGHRLFASAAFGVFVDGPQARIVQTALSGPLLGIVLPRQLIHAVQVVQSTAR